ncbi:MAG: hypothetical protein WC679_05175 [Bacteroidales bacterium]|jgi:hypothetical protein
MLANRNNISVGTFKMASYICSLRGISKKSSKMDLEEKESSLCKKIQYRISLFMPKEKIERVNIIPLQSRFYIKKC